MRIAIIGAGLAGCAAAYVLKKLGAEPVIYEIGSEIAPGASGNSVGLYNPRLSAEPGFYSEAFPRALWIFSELKDIGWNKCGALHLLTNEKRGVRFRQAVQSWNWPEDSMRIVSPSEASDIAGVEVQHEALYLADSGTVSPKKLCERYVEGVEVHLNNTDEMVKADVVIGAAGMATKHFPLKAVRGQITEVKATDLSRKLKTNLCYGGYFAPEIDGKHALGATFQRWLDHAQIIEKDDEDNIEKLRKVARELAEGLEVTGHRAAVRTTSPDHFPIIGQVGESEYVSTAHGSHGIVSSIAAAHILAAMIMGKPLSFTRDTLQKINPTRFHS